MQEPQDRGAKDENNEGDEIEKKLASHAQAAGNGTNHVCDFDFHNGKTWDRIGCVPDKSCVANIHEDVVIPSRSGS